MHPTFNDHAAWEGCGQRPPAGPQLLVSVRDHDEFQAAWAAAVDIVDLKEPRQGPLAPASISLWHQVAGVDRRGSRSLLSAALGERHEALAIAAQLPPQFAFAKVGPSGCEHPAQLQKMWSQIRSLLAPQIELVGVAYADFRNAGCLAPEEVFQQAIEAGLQRCLIDTYIKNGTSTLDQLGIDALERLAKLAGRAGLWWTLAGSIQSSHAELLWRRGIKPDCFGVRGDVCDRGRTGRLSQPRLAAWKTLLETLESDSVGPFQPGQLP